MRGWGRETQERIVELLDEAEKACSCAVPDDEVTRQALRRRVRRGQLVSPLPGMYTRVTTWREVAKDPTRKTEFLIRGLSRRSPGSVACEASAAVIHGLWVSHRRLDALHVVGKGPGRLVRGVRIVHHRSRGVDPVCVGGVLVTPLLTTVADCLQGFSFADGLAIADSTVRKLGWDSERLAEELLRNVRPKKGLDRVLATAAQANPLAESGGESIARAAIIELGYVVPRLQVKIDNPLAPGSFRVDGLWIMPGGLVVLLEVDGMEKRVNPAMTQGRSTAAVLADERQRDSFISATGARILHVGYRDFVNPKRFARLLDAYGVPLVNSRAGRLMRMDDSAMNGGEPEANGAVIRDGWLRFE